MTAIVRDQLIEAFDGLEYAIPPDVLMMFANSETFELPRLDAQDMFQVGMAWGHLNAIVDRLGLGIHEAITVYKIEVCMASIELAEKLDNTSMIAPRLWKRTAVLTASGAADPHVV